MGYKTFLYNGKTILTSGGKMLLNTFSTIPSNHYLIDFGDIDYQTPGNWNNIYQSGITFLIDTSGVTSTISLNIPECGTGTYFTLPGSAIYPISAIRDGMAFMGPGFNINGLNINKIYDIYLYSYSQSSEEIMIYTVSDNNGTSEYYLNIYNNTTNEILSPDRIPTSGGTITIGVAGSGETNELLSVMEIVEKTPVTYDSSSIQKVLLTFNTIPSSTGITKAALKYDKRFAFSYVWDDNMIEQYTYGFKYMNGGVAGDSAYYSGKTYTDGCGNKIKFNAGLSIFSFNGGSPYPGADVHTPVFNGSIQWSQYPEMYNAGWALTSHSLTHSDYNSSYDIERNRSYVYLQTSGATIKIFTQPANYQTYGTHVWAITGTTKYITYQNGNDWQWFGNGSAAIPAGRVDGGDLVDGSNRISYSAWPVKDFNMYRTFCTSAAEIQTQVLNLLKATGTTYHTWKSFLCHGINGGGGGFGSFSDFKAAMDYIETNHGSIAGDDCWMVNDQDVYEYLITHATTIVSQVANQNTLELTFSWANTNSGNTLPDDMRKYCLSLLVSGNTSISDIIIYGGTGSTYNKSYKINTALVNLNWNGGLSESARLLRTATERVEIAEATTTAEDIAIAQDYVSAMSAGTDKTNLQNRLNAI